MDLSVSVSDGVELRVRHRPGVQPRAFMLLHGLTSNARLWDDVADRLATRGHPVYAVDLRGHGESDTPDDGYDTATAAADVAKVGSSLGLNGVVVAGHSWGASVALRLAAENPELVAGLALVDGGWVDFTAAVGDKDLSAGFAGSLQQKSTMPGITSLERLRDYLRAIHPGWSDGAIDAYVEEMCVGQDGTVRPRLANAHHTSIVQSLWDEPPSRWYPSVHIPVMLLPALPPASIWWVEELRSWVKRAEAALPQATTRWYEDADHHLHVEYPDRITADLIDLAGETGYNLVV